MKLFLVILAFILTSCANDIAGLSRAERLIIYGTALDIAGHPEIGKPLRALAKTLGKQPVRNINP